MDSESEDESEDENNHTYTTYPAGESFRNPSPQHIPQPTNHTVSVAVIIGIQKNGNDLKIIKCLLQINNYILIFFVKIFLTQVITTMEIQFGIVRIVQPICGMVKELENVVVVPILSSQCVVNVVRLCFLVLQILR